jgi:hypothetical protein
MLGEKRKEMVRER